MKSKIVKTSGRLYPDFVLKLLCETVAGVVIILVILAIEAKIKEADKAKDKPNPRLLFQALFDDPDYKGGAGGSHY